MAWVPKPNCVGLIEILRQVVRNPLLPFDSSMKCGGVIEQEVIFEFSALPAGT